MSARVRPAPAIPHLVRVHQLVELMPALKERTVRHWIAQAQPLVVKSRGRKKTIPGNGLAPAILRKGKVVLVDVEKFVAWLYDGSSA